MRLEKVLPSIINSKQAGFVKGRNTVKCTRTIDDVIYSTNHKKRPGIALNLDFKKITKKTIDKIDHNFIREAVLTFNFGELFI